MFVGWLDDGKGKRAGAHDRNLLRYVFLEPAARKLIHDWEERARRVLAEFRADRGRSAQRRRHRKALIEICAGKSAHLRAPVRAEQAVLGREGGERTFDHPQDGFLRYRQIGFTLAARHDLKLVMLVPEAPPKRQTKRRSS